MISASHQRFSVPKEIVEEHAAIQVIVRWVEFELQRCALSEGPRAAGSLLGALEVLSEHLGRHFAFEERTGFLRAAILALPEGQSRFLEWKQQHVDLLERLHGCLNTVRSTLGPDSPPGPPLHATLRAWFHDLGEHQAFENRLLGTQGNGASPPGQRD